MQLVRVTAEQISSERLFQPTESNKNLLQILEISRTWQRRQRELNIYFNAYKLDENLISYFVQAMLLERIRQLEIMKQAMNKFIAAVYG